MKPPIVELNQDEGIDRNAQGVEGVKKLRRNFVEGHTLPIRAEVFCETAIVEYSI